MRRSFTSRRRWHSSSAFAVVLLVFGCARELSGPDNDVELAISIAEIVDSAAVGSTGINSILISIVASDSGEYDWEIVTTGSAWLNPSAITGTTPGEISVHLNPLGLSVARYDDTLFVGLEESEHEPVVVPVAFRVIPCSQMPLETGIPIVAELGVRDCGAPRRAGRFADLYVFDGTAGDTLSIIMLSNALDAYVLVDSVPEAGSPGIAESDSCPDSSGNACLLAFTLPYTGQYFVEATTEAETQVGAYVIDVSPPRSPEPPLELRQLQIDSINAIDVGGSAQTSEVIIGALVSDPDVYDELRLQVELRSIDEAFTGIPTAESVAAVSDHLAFVSHGGLLEDGLYRWRARVIDGTGRSSTWMSFGNNGESDVDLTGPTAGALHLQFDVQPEDVEAGGTVEPAVSVSVRNASDDIVQDFASPLSVSIAPGTGTVGAVLSGTLSVTPTSGVATFSDLSVSAVGTGYRLIVSGDGVASAASGTFDVAGNVPQVVLFAQGFSSPLFVTAPPDDTSRVVVVEQGGRIRIVRNGAVLGTPFLDLSSQITSGGERGLLGLAFAPDYESSGTFYVNHTGSDGSTRVVRYGVSGNPDIADVSSADTLLVVAQPFSNHNGGHMAFGPDGMLYIGLGDGGSGGDPQGHGQNLGTLLGNILRIDVSGAGTEYTIPTDNPFASDPSSRSEIWISGVRNPWRFSFDRMTGDLYVGDVGQGSWEEVTVQPAGSNGGENFGWNVMEGGHCYQPSSGCNQTGLTLPVLEYSHASGCSITGGYVYRGERVPGLVGTYLYSDYCSGWVRGFRFLNGQSTSEIQLSVPFSGNVTSFGEDAVGNVYVVLEDGRIFRIQ